MAVHRTLRSMNIVLNGDNQVEALRPIGLPRRVGADEILILLKANRFDISCDHS